MIKCAAVAKWVDHSSQVAEVQVWTRVLAISPDKCYPRLLTVTIDPRRVDGVKQVNNKGGNCKVAISYTVFPWIL